MLSNREIEVKLLIQQANFNLVKGLINPILCMSSSLVSLETGVYADQYWQVSGADFLRLRTGRYPELTSKRTDGRGTLNREERTFAVSKESIGQLESVLELALGESKGSIFWQFAEWKLDDYAVSLISNIDDRQNVFLEVEGKDEVTVIVAASSIKKLLSEEFPNSVHETVNSFYDAYILKNGVKTK